MGLPLTAAGRSIPENATHAVVAKSARSPQRPCRRPDSWACELRRRALDQTSAGRRGCATERTWPVISRPVQRQPVYPSLQTEKPQRPFAADSTNRHAPPALPFSSASESDMSRNLPHEDPPRCTLNQKWMTRPYPTRRSALPSRPTARRGVADDVKLTLY